MKHWRFSVKTVKVREFLRQKYWRQLTFARCILSRPWNCQRKCEARLQYCPVLGLFTPPAARPGRHGPPNVRYMIRSMENSHSDNQIQLQRTRQLNSAEKNKKAIIPCENYQFWPSVIARTIIHKRDRAQFHALNPILWQSNKPNRILPHTSLSGNRIYVVRDWSLVAALNGISIINSSWREDISTPERWLKAIIRFYWEQKIDIFRYVGI